MAQAQNSIEEFGTYAIGVVAKQGSCEASWSLDKPDTLEIRPRIPTEDVDRIEIWLSNAVREIEEGGLTKEEALETYVLSAIRRLESPEIFQTDDLFALVRHKDYLGDGVVGQFAEGQKMAPLVDGSLSPAAYESLVGDLVVVLAARVEGGFTLSVSEQISRENVPYDLAKKAAVERTLAAVQDVDVNEFSSGVGAIIVHGQDDSGTISGFTLSKVLDEEFWNVLGEKYASDLAVGLPDRDTIFYAPADDRSRVEALREATRKWFEGAHHEQSPDIILWTDKGWRVNC